MELRRFRADLHIHSCLSPCGELTNYPRHIVERAVEEGLDIIAVTDHNTAENAAAVVRAAEGTELTVLPGMELTSEEEVHVLGVFGDLAGLRPVQDQVFRSLPDVPASKKTAENQVVVDENDDVTGFSARPLLAATRMDVREIVSLIHRFGGLAIASHIDKDAFSVISQLGFIPPGLDFDALEVSPLMTAAAARTAFGLNPAIPLVRFSDAHRPEDIGRTSTDFLLAEPSLEEIRSALRSEKKRKICRS